VLGLDSNPPRQREFILVLSVHNHLRQFRPQNARNQVRKLPIAQDSGSAEFLDIDLVENLASRGEWFDKNGLLIADRVGNHVQILQWQRQIFREGAVMRDDAQHGSARTVRLEPAPAKSAQRSIPVSRTRHIDLAHDTSAKPAITFPRRNAANLHNFADKFVPGSAAKSVIPAKNLNVGIANPRQPHPHECPPFPQFRQRFIFHDQSVLLDYEGAHLMQRG
jgi:hypothetical protein